MPIKWSDTKQTEIQGLLYVQSIVNDAGSIFNKIDGTTDIGLDGNIEFIRDKSPTGLCLGIQIKSGNSNISDNNTISFKADRNHFEYWYNHILPIIGIVYIPKMETAYWIDITRYLAINEDVIEDGPFTIHVPIENCFDLKGFTLFHYSVNNYLDSYGDDKFFGRALKRLADLKNPENRYDAIKSLFSFHRDKIETWYFLISKFCFEVDSKIQLALVYAYRHILEHGDIWWHPGNIMEEEIGKEARTFFSKFFGFNEAKKLLYLINEGGISRGSVGYDLNLILRLIPGRIDYLKKIILNDDTPDDNRYWSATCLINEFQYRDLDRAINFTNSMITNFPKSEHIDDFLIIKEALTEYEGFDFCG
jgi:hypothetical protein